MMDDLDAEAMSETTAFERERYERRKVGMECLNIGMAVENVYEELGIGDEPPTFGNGQRAFVVKIRKDIARQLYEDLDEHFGDE